MYKKEKIKVFVFEDQQAFTDGVRLYFQHSESIQFVGSAKTEEECLRKTKNKPIDILLMDIRLKHDPIGGIKLAKEIIERFKADGNDPLIVFLSGFSNKEYISHAHDLNCSFLSKDLDMPTIIEKIENIYQTKKPSVVVEDIDGINAGLKGKNIEKELLQQRLTPKQGQVAVNLYAYGSNKEVARKLNLSIHTVNTNLRDIYVRLDLSGKDHRRETLLKMIVQSGLNDHFEEINDQPEDWFGEKRSY